MYNSNKSIATISLFYAHLSVRMSILNNKFKNFSPKKTFVQQCKWTAFSWLKLDCAVIQKMAAHGHMIWPPFWSLHVWAVALVEKLCSGRKRDSRPETSECNRKDETYLQTEWVITVKRTGLIFSAQIIWSSQLDETQPPSPLSVILFNFSRQFTKKKGAGDLTGYK